MKILLASIFALFLSLAVFGQVDSNLPIPQETYSKDSKRLVKLSNLRGKMSNGRRNFTGKISRVQWNNDYDTVYFDIGKETFEIIFSNLSNAGRSYLKDLVKKNNRVSLKAYAGGSNGVWLVISISRI